MIKAEIIADSINPDGDRLTTFLLTYPRFIHSELMTHRAFSRNASSSRAIPIWKMIRAVLRNPAMPVSWGANCSGMQAEREVHGVFNWLAKFIWRLASWFACLFCWLLAKCGTHKQLANRVIEPWAHMTTLVSATDWENFYALRAHKDAQPEFRELAFTMLGEYLRSEPKRLEWGDWHVPYPGNLEGLTEEEQKKVVVARAARTSYWNFDGTADVQKDVKLHDRLSESGHMSPFEHAAEARRGRYGNFRGFLQYRKMLPNEDRCINLQRLWEEHVNKLDQVDPS